MSPTLTVSSFFRPVLFPLFCSTSSTWTTVVQNILETPEPRSKQKHRRPEPRKHRTPILVFFTRIFFGAMRFFFEFFRIPPKGLPFICFDILPHNGCQKIPKGLHFSALWHCSKISVSIFFRKFFEISQGSPFNFFIFCTTGVSQSPKGPAFYNFEP